MNLPVLFRTIDGASQATIETRIRHGAAWMQPDGMAKCRRLRFSFFKKTITARSVACLLAFWLVKEMGL
jgi:hypothetical protein